MARFGVLAAGLCIAACSVSTGSSAPVREDQPVAKTPPEPEPEPEPGDEDALAIPHDMPGLDTPCETRRTFVLGQVDGALEFASAGCTEDADCVRAGRSTGCRGACPTAVLATHAEAYESMRDSVDQRVCTGYRDDGCPYATPRCASGSPRCVDGRCEFAR